MVLMNSGIQWDVESHHHQKQCQCVVLGTVLHAIGVELDVRRQSDVHASGTLSTGRPTVVSRSYPHNY